METPRVCIKQIYLGFPQIADLIRLQLLIRSDVAHIVQQGVILIAISSYKSYINDDNRLMMLQDQAL